MTDLESDGPLFITSAPELLTGDSVPATEVKQLLLDHVFTAGDAHGSPRRNRSEGTIA